MSKSYFLLLAKKTIVSLMKFLFPKSKLTNQAYDSVHLALATQKEMKKFKDLSIKNYKDLFFIFHLYLMKMKLKIFMQIYTLTQDKILNSILVKENYPK